MFTAFKGYQDEASKRVVPKDAAGYEFTLSDAAKPFFADGEKDPAIGVLKDVAHKHGLPQNQFVGFINDLLPALREKGVIDAYDSQKEIDYVREQLGLAKDKDGKAALTRHFDDMDAFAEGLAKQWGLTPEQTGTLAALNDTGAGSLVLAKIRASLDEHGIQVDVTTRPAAGGGLSKEQLHKLDGDPRIEPSSAKFDPALRAQYDAAYQHHYKG